MPCGPKGKRRPVDVIGNAVKVMWIATGEEVDTVVDDGKDPAAKALKAKGGAARAKAITPEAVRRRDNGEETLAEIGRSYDVSPQTIGEAGSMTVWDAESVSDLTRSYGVSPAAIYRTTA